MKRIIKVCLASAVLISSSILTNATIQSNQTAESNAVYSPTQNANAWALKSHNASLAHMRGFSGQGVKVAILDSGIDTDNELLKHAIKGGTSVVDWSDDYEDMSGHGTSVAGALVAKYQGQVYGIAPDVDLYAVKITSSPMQDEAKIQDMIEGIEWSIENNMDIINLSYDVRAVSKEFEEVVNKAKDNGIPIINSTGNNSQDIDNQETRCQYEGVYCISAIDERDKIGLASAYGIKEVDFGASGVFVASAQMGSNKLTVASGTSIATPVFVGLYALHKSEFPNATSEQIMKHLENTALKLNTERPIGKYGKVYYTPMNLKYEYNSK